MEREHISDEEMAMILASRATKREVNIPNGISAGIQISNGHQHTFGDGFKVTSFEDLKQYAAGKMVVLPDFADGQPFVAMLKRPSILGLAQAGKIPNELLVAANSLFNKGSSSADPDDKDMMKDLFSVMELVCKESLVSPSYSEIKDAGVQLSDEQMMAIFSYTQVGVKALENFR